MLWFPLTWNRGHHFLISKGSWFTSRSTTLFLAICEAYGILIKKYLLLFVVKRWEELIPSTINIICIKIRGNVSEKMATFIVCNIDMSTQGIPQLETCFRKTSRSCYRWKQSSNRMFSALDYRQMKSQASKSSYPWD